MSEAKSFIYEDSKHITHEIVIAPSDLEFVQEDKTLSDSKMQSRPTTFFKDAMRRFRKNKSSVVAAGILGVLVLLSLILPFALDSDVSTSHPYETYLEPKLFDAGFGWWDGTKAYEHMTMDIDWDEYEKSGTLSGLPADTEEKDIVGGRSGVTMTKIGEETTDSASIYAHGGSIRLSHTVSQSAITTYTSPALLTFDYSEENTYEISLETLDPASEESFTYGIGAPYSLAITYLDDSGSSKEIYLFENKDTFGKTIISSDSIKEALVKATGSNTPVLSTQNNVALRLSLSNIETSASTTNLLLKSLVISSSKEEDKENFASISITNPNNTLLLENEYMWNRNNGLTSVYRADIIYGSYRIDTYEKVYGNYYDTNISQAKLEKYKEYGWISVDLSPLNNLSSMSSKSARDALVQSVADSIQVLDPTHCPLVIDENHPLTGTSIRGGGITTASFLGTITRWKDLYPNRNSMPRYLFGTDSMGRDMLNYVFTGLRTSLILGLCTFVVCFCFGLVWGSISGYFGGNVDMIMERVVEILSGIPTIVLLTLAIIKFGSNFVTFALALCLTGWIGTASLSRTQFYRFKDREYILAARTLGASDSRLIFKHILPNAVGTIITSAVLMIPSVIYSEATISYLGLGLQGLASLGVILSENQINISLNSYLILFPSAVMALLMISFNLFGNGLRDAFNPSLKGQD